MESRLLAIYAAYAEHILSLVPLQIEDEYLKVVILPDRWQQFADNRGMGRCGIGPL
jgi:hypothetical protein